MANRVEPDDNMRPTTRQGPTVSVSARSLDPEDVDTTPMKLKPGFTRMSLCAVDEVLEDSLQALQRGNPAAAKNAKSLGRLLSVAASKRIRGGDGETLVKLSDILSGNDDEEGCEAGVDQRLLGYDEDGDGYLNKEELRNAVRGELDAIRRAGDEAVRRKRITLALIGVAVLLVVVLAVNSGLTYAVVKMSHQTSMSESDPQMRVRDTETVVQTASADFKVVDGSLVPRSSENDNESSAGTMKTADAVVQGFFHSELPMASLKELRWIHIESESSGAELSIAVHAVMKRPRGGDPEVPDELQRHVVQVFTHLGVIEVVGEDFFFTDTHPMAVFEAAGFTMRGRRLLGLSKVLGFYNFISGLEVFALPEGEEKPYLPPSYTMTMKVYAPCERPGKYVDDGNQELDLCQEWRDPQVHEETGVAVKGAFDQEAMPGLYSAENGKTYMAYIETAWVNHDAKAIRVKRKYAAYRNMAEMRMLDLATNRRFTWQDVYPMVDGGDVANTPPKPFQCEDAEIPEQFAHLEYLDAGGSLISSNFSFIGYEEVNGIPARHFSLELVVGDPEGAKQLGGTTLAGTQQINIEMYDGAANGNTPLRFVFPKFALKDEEGNDSRVVAEETIIDVLSFSAETQDAEQIKQLPVVDAEDLAACPRGNQVPGMASSFDPPLRVQTQAEIDLLELEDELTENDADGEPVDEGDPSDPNRSIMLFTSVVVPIEEDIDDDPETDGDDYDSMDDEGWDEDGAEYDDYGSDYVSINGTDEGPGRRRLQGTAAEVNCADKLSEIYPILGLKDLLIMRHRPGSLLKPKIYWPLGTTPLCPTCGPFLQKSSKLKIDFCEMTAQGKMSIEVGLQAFFKIGKVVLAGMVKDAAEDSLKDMTDIPNGSIKCPWYLRAKCEALDFLIDYVVPWLPNYELASVTATMVKTPFPHVDILARGSTHHCISFYCYKIRLSIEAELTPATFRWRTYMDFYEGIPYVTMPWQGKKQITGWRYQLGTKKIRNELMVRKDKQCYGKIYGPYGKWTGWKYCPKNSYVYKGQAKFEKRSAEDTTALSNARFWCKDASTKKNAGSLTFQEGHSWGSWKDTKKCTYWAKNFRMLIMKEQGGLWDDYAAANLRLGCSYDKGGGELTHVKDYSSSKDSDEMSWYPRYDWTTECDTGTYVCGVSMQIEEKQYGSDDTAVNGIRFMCCRIGRSQPSNIYRRCRGVSGGTKNAHCDSGRKNDVSKWRNQGYNCRD